MIGSTEGWKTFSHPPVEPVTPLFARSQAGDQCLSFPEVRRSAMAVIHLETLVLRGNVLAGVNRLAVVTRINSSKVACQTPDSMSQRRRTSPSCSEAGYQPRSWHDFADALGADHAGMRAGRSGSFADVLVRRSSAPGAEWPILSGWSSALGESNPTASECRGSMPSIPPVSVGRMLPERVPVTPTSPVRAERQGRQDCLPPGKQLGKQGEARAAWFMPRDGALAASTRG